MKTRKAASDAVRSSGGGRDVRKEVLGVLAGIGVFGGAFLTGIPPLFAAGAGAAAFTTAFLLTPRRKKGALLIAPDVTQEMLDDYLGRLRASLGRIREWDQEINRRSMNDKIHSLCKALARIVADCEKDPQDVRLARSLPFYTEKIEEYVRGYVTLLEAGQDDEELLKRLEATEAMIVQATEKFEELYRAMLENDLRSLEARAGALSMELEPEDSEAGRTEPHG